MTVSDFEPERQFILPPDDLSRSPHTGYVRAHWEAMADHLLQGARRFSSPGYALVDYPSSKPASAVDRLEGFARTFLLAALRIAGSQGQQQDLIEWYRRALVSGVDPHGPECWPALTDHSQPTVEAAAIAVGLHVAQTWLWDGLDVRTQSRLIDWFSGSRGTWCADNNHVLLGATLTAFVESVGGEVHAVEVDEALDRIDDWYVGDGWYTDGEGRRFDYYNAWAFQFYPFFICRMVGNRLDERRHLYRGRLRMFLAGYEHLFGATGSPLIQGRSLIYRWGVVAPFWMAQQEGVDALTPGRTRRLCSGVLKHFVDAGVGADGTLGLGWHADHAGILQSYNAAGSPHWASKGFLGLLLPPEHPAWHAPEEPLEIERRDVRRVLTGPRWLVDGRHDDGVVRVHNFGSDGHPQKDDGLYRRLVFSSATAPVLHASVRDNDITVPMAGVRHRCLQRGVAGIDGGRLKRTLDAAGREVIVDYAVKIVGDYELRAARLRGVIGLPVRLTGYAIAADATPTGSPRADDPGWPTVEVHTATQSTMIAWLGSSTPLEVTGQVFRPEGGNALGAVSAVPGLSIERCAVEEVTLVWAVTLNGELPNTPARVVSDACAVSVTMGDDNIVMHWVRGPFWPADSINQGVFRARGLT